MMDPTVSEALHRGIIKGTLESFWIVFKSMWWLVPLAILIKIFEAGLIEKLIIGKGEEDFI